MTGGLVSTYTPPTTSSHPHRAIQDGSTRPPPPLLLWHPTPPTFPPPSLPSPPLNGHISCVVFSLQKDLWGDGSTLQCVSNSTKYTAWQSAHNCATFFFFFCLRSFQKRAEFLFFPCLFVFFSLPSNPQHCVVLFKYKYIIIRWEILYWSQGEEMMFDTALHY